MTQEQVQIIVDAIRTLSIVVAINGVAITISIFTSGFMRR